MQENEEDVEADFAFGDVEAPPKRNSTEVVAAGVTLEAPDATASQQSKESLGSKDSQGSKGRRGSQGSGLRSSLKFKEPGAAGSALGSGLQASSDLKASGDLLQSSGDILQTSTDIDLTQSASMATKEGFGLMEMVEPEEETFKAEPLHVRYLCKSEHRRAVAEIKEEDQRWNDLQTELMEPTISDEKRQEIEDQIRKLRYKNKLRQLRFERLSQLNPKTHEEFPAQLIEAARDGDASYVHLAFEAKVDMDVQDKELKVTPLIVATISNKMTVMKLLLKLKANPRVQDVNGATCVHYAVQLDHVHALAALLDANPGQDWDALTMKDSRSMSPVDYARRPERSACLRLLMNRMGGPMPVAWQVFKGWLSDKTGCCRPQVVKQKSGSLLCSCTQICTAKK